MMRIFHHWERWECVPAGMYEMAPPPGMTPDTAKAAYADFLSDSGRFTAALQRVIAEWPISCEQFLSNESMNRVAWLGQASMCIATGVPSRYRAGFMLLSDAEQCCANATADACLALWLRRLEGEQLCLPLA